MTNNNQSLTFSQLGGNGGLHFLGSIRGVLPIGPNGVPEFDTLKPSPFSDPKIMAGIVSYDYTLEQQGLTSNVSCGFSSRIPFNTSFLDPQTRLALGYNISCGNEYGEFEVLKDVGLFKSTWSNNTLLYWACQSALNGTRTDSYSIYLGGVGIPGGLYPTKIGYITCSVKPIKTAIFPVRFDSTTNIFSTAQPAPESSQAITFPDLLAHALVGLGQVIVEGQNYEANLVAESILTFAYKSFNVSVNATRPPEFLWLFEKMIQGIIEYEVCSVDMLSRHPSYRHPSGRLPAIDILDGRRSPP